MGCGSSTDVIKNAVLSEHEKALSSRNSIPDSRGLLLHDNNNSKTILPRVFLF